MHNASGRDAIKSTALLTAHNFQDQSVCIYRYFVHEASEVGLPTQTTQRKKKFKKIKSTSAGNDNRFVVFLSFSLSFFLSLLVVLLLLLRSRFDDDLPQGPFFREKTYTRCTLGTIPTSIYIHTQRD